MELRTAVGLTSVFTLLIHQHVWKWSSFWLIFKYSCRFCRAHMLVLWMINAFVIWGAPLVCRSGPLLNGKQVFICDELMRALDRFWLDRGGAWTSTGEENPQTGPPLPTSETTSFVLLSSFFYFSFLPVVLGVQCVSVRCMRLDLHVISCPYE